MNRYIVQRLLFGVLVLWGVSILVFLMIRLIPGDVVYLILGQAVRSPQQVAEVRHSLGLDQPIPVQYWVWISSAFHGDLGKSFYSQQPVAAQIVKTFPVTAQLAIMAMIASLVIAIPIGVISAIRQDTPIDYLLRFMSILGLSIPGFWIGTLMIVVPSLLFNISPPLFYQSFFQNPGENIRHLGLPAIALGIGLSASVMRMTRSALLEVLRQDYIRTAWSKGLRERVVIVRHALKNAFIPVVTLTGVQLGVLLGGTVIMETVFSVPGMGKLTVDSFFLKDYTQVQANVLVYCLVFVVVNILVDVTYSWLDPRIRYA